MSVEKATAIDFMALFAGQADVLRGAPSWRDRAEDLAAFLAAHEGWLPDTASFTMLLQIGGLLIFAAEQQEQEDRI